MFELYCCSGALNERQEKSSVGERSVGSQLITCYLAEWQSCSRIPACSCSTRARSNEADSPARTSSNTLSKASSCCISGLSLVVEMERY